jgi:hypothetical protein
MGYNHVDCIIKKDELYNNVDVNTIGFESKMIEYKEKNKLDLFHLAGLFVFKSFFNCAEIVDGQNMIQADLDWYGLNDYGTLKDCYVCIIPGYLVTNKEIIKEIKNTKTDDFEDCISDENNKITRNGFHAGHFILLYKKTTKEVRHVFFHESPETKKLYKSDFIL